MLCLSVCVCVCMYVCMHVFVRWQFTSVPWQRATNRHINIAAHANMDIHAPKSGLEESHRGAAAHVSAVDTQGKDGRRPGSLGAHILGPSSQRRNESGLSWCVRAQDSDSCVCSVFFVYGYVCIYMYILCVLIIFCVYVYVTVCVYTYMYISCVFK